MLSLLYAYLCVPRRLRFILRWLAACVFLVVLVLVLMLFYRVLMTHAKASRMDSPSTATSAAYPPTSSVTTRTGTIAPRRLCDA